MSLQGEEEALGRTNSGFVGLDNQGATCYLNALLQVRIFRSDHFVPWPQEGVLPTSLTQSFVRMVGTAATPCLVLKSMSFPVCYAFDVQR